MSLLGVRMAVRMPPILVALAILTGSGCTAAGLGNAPLLHWEPGRATVPVPGSRSDELLLILAFSGGGTRAAAVAYGILEVGLRSRPSSICSDLSSYRVALAVTASSAVPVLLTPVALENRAGSCGYLAPTCDLPRLASQERRARPIGASTAMPGLCPRRT